MYIFDYQIDYSTNSGNRTSVPFAVFGMSQEGFAHKHNSIGNQDSARIFIGKNILLGVVADGCTSGKNINHFSYNQVGSSIITYVIEQLARKMVVAKNFSFADFQLNFEKALCNRIKKIIQSISIYKNEQRNIIANFFASTFILSIITKEEYYIISCGDGSIMINENYINNSNQSGVYFSNNLLFHESSTITKLRFPTQLVSKGFTKDVNSIIISTDGFMDKEISELQSFKNFFLNPSKIDTPEMGFVDLRSEFRKQVVSPIINAKNESIWPQDDATFISFMKSK